MGKKNKKGLNPEWMFKEPIDFEYNKYTLLDYLQKCEKKFDNFELYPEFVELSLHLASVQTLVKENTILITNKKMEDWDDEILLKDLIPKNPPNVKSEYRKDLELTLKFSLSRIMDTFNIGKSLWNVVFDDVMISLKKNKDSTSFRDGFCYYQNKKENKLYVWEYSIKRSNLDETVNKTYLTLIYNDEIPKKRITSIISKNTSFTDSHTSLPVFECKCDRNYPFNETLVPMIRRKLMSTIYQIINFKKPESHKI